MGKVFQDYIRRLQKGGNKLTIASNLYIACVSGYYSKVDWQEWADRQILKKDTVEDWIYEVSLAKDLNELSLAVGAKMLDESYYEKNRFSKSDVIVGYYYLQFLENKITLRDLISKLSDEDDPSNSSSINEFLNFYAIMGEINLDNSILKEPLFDQKLAIVFDPYKQIAESQKEQLESY